ncbi:GNAT family N-acetyltransferase [Aureibacter tunicatorum]|uniref:Phosphinothricin acetyltransferase n=1 Tax=Aureibacter tunicatorum TaxID=866807 RepID=A0AAE4BUV1_9BACT|nr:N-acetyltransferase family protein [Aureibacter tunicatorum]MDR6241197.1 phosphinothricin acetyltransferase [Aureibacter tunicatorum]BDD03972.1 phosphinothricin N-acetyltransferase [Aureibacter tunicatorum]
MNDKLIFRKLEKSDWEKVSQIYSEGLDTGNATFETNIPSWESWNNSHLNDCRHVAEINGKVAGWSALSPVSSRCVYGGVAEVSVYVSSEFEGQKIGTRLLEKLIKESEAIGIWTLQAGIFPENLGSLKIHKRLDFREVGFREKIGQLNGVWRDTVLLERRSKKIGI